MENEIKNVALSFCCKEDWNTFASIDEQTRFCGTCKHNVIDFTNSTRDDFHQAMNSGQKICGRFKRSQMSESFLKIAAASVVAVASASSISCNENEKIAPHIPKEDICEKTTLGVIVMGVPPVPDSLELGSTYLPIVVGDAPKGEEPLRYNPAFPAKGFYKNK